MPQAALVISRLDQLLIGAAADKHVPVYDSSIHDWRTRPLSANDIPDFVSTVIANAPAPNLAPYARLDGAAFIGAVSAPAATFTAAAAGSTPLTLVAHAGQTAPLMTTPHVQVDSHGDLRGAFSICRASDGTPLVNFDEGPQPRFVYGLTSGAYGIRTDGYFGNYTYNVPTALINVFSGPVIIGDQYLISGDPTGNAVVLAQDVTVRAGKIVHLSGVGASSAALKIIADGTQPSIRVRSYDDGSDWFTVSAYGSVYATSFNPIAATGAYDGAGVLVDSGAGFRWRQSAYGSEVLSLHKDVDHNLVVGDGSAGFRNLTAGTATLKSTGVDNVIGLRVTRTDVNEHLDLIASVNNAGSAVVAATNLFLQPGSGSNLYLYDGSGITQLLVNGTGLNAGKLTLTANSAGETPLTLVPHAGQTAPLMVMPNSQFDVTGDLRVQSGQTFSLKDYAGTPIFSVSFGVPVINFGAIVPAGNLVLNSGLVASSGGFSNDGGGNPTRVFNYANTNPVLIGDSTLATGDPAGSAVILAQDVTVRAGKSLSIHKDGIGLDVRSETFTGGAIQTWGYSGGVTAFLRDTGFLQLNSIQIGAGIYVEGAVTLLGSDHKISFGSGTSAFTGSVLDLHKDSSHNLVVGDGGSGLRGITASRLRVGYTDPNISTIPGIVSSHGSDAYLGAAVGPALAYLEMYAGGGGIDTYDYTTLTGFQLNIGGYNGGGNTTVLRFWAHAAEQGQVRQDGWHFYSPIQLQNQSSAPATPYGGGSLYTDNSGNLHYIGPSGTDTQLAAA